MSTDAKFYPGVSGDDCTYAPGPYFDNTDVVLALGDVDSGFTIRFPNVTIPPGASIVSAHVTLTACNPLSGADVASCYFNNVDNAVAPTSYAEATGLARTSGVSWNVPNTTANTPVDTPGLKDILQTVIDRAGWASGNAVQVIVEVDAVEGTRDFYAIDYNSGQYKAELHVVYEAGTCDFANIPIQLTAAMEGDIQCGGYLNQELPALEMTGTLVSRSAFVIEALPALEILATGQVGNVGRLIQILPALDLAVYGAGRLESILPALELSGHIITGISGSLNQILPALEISAHGFAAQTGSLAVILPPLEISAHGTVTVVGRLSEILPALTLRASGLTGSVGSAVLTLPALEIAATGIVHGLGNINQILPALEINAHGRVVVPIASYKVIVLNPKSLTVSEYKGFVFNSFALFNGKYLGATSVGIHVLEGGKDNGKNIDTALCLGQIPISGGKPRDIWIMGRSEGPMIVTMSEDEDPAEEDRVEYLISSLGQDRAKVPRGMDPSYFQVGLKNAQGCAFDLDSIQVFGEAVKRRKH